MRRILRAAAVAIVSLYVLYVVGANVFLSTSAFDALVNRPDSVELDVHYRKGWTILPGRVHARELSIRASDSNVEWLLQIDEVTFDVSLIGLVQRRFDLTKVRGRGVALRVRQKLDAAPASPEEVAWLPPIPGYPSYSVRPSGPPSPDRWDDSKYRLWALRLGDVIAEDVRELWIDEARFAGDARVTGGFYLKPIREARVGPARVEVRSGIVTAGPSLPIARRVAGTATVVLDPFDPRVVSGRHVLRRLTLTADLAGSLADLHDLPLATPFHLSGELAVPRLELRVEHGVLATGTFVEAGTDRLSAVFEDTAAGDVAHPSITGRAGLDLALHVDDRLRGSLGLRDISLERQPSERDTVPLGRASRVGVTIESPDLDLVSDLFDQMRVVVDVPEARITETRARGTVATVASFDVVQRERLKDAKLSAVLTDGAIALNSEPKTQRFSFETLLVDARAAVVDFTDPTRSLEVSFATPDASEADIGLGRGVRLRARSHFELDGHFVVDDHIARGKLHTRADRLRLEVGSLRLAAKAEARANMHDWLWERDGLRIEDGAVALRDVTVIRSRATLATIHGVDVDVHHFDFAAPRLDRLDGRVAIRGAELPDARALNGTLLSEGNGIHIASGSATAAGAIRISSLERAASGMLDVSIQDGSVVVHDTTLAGNFDVRAKARGFDPKTATLDISGSTMRATTASWRGNALLEDASLCLAPADTSGRSRAELDARLRFDANDAQPLLRLIVGDSAPGLLVKLADMPNLEATAQLRIAPHVFVLSDVSAHGGDVSVRGAYALYGDDPRGAFVVEKGPFSVGLGVDQDGASPHFFNLGVWLSERERSLKDRPPAEPAEPLGRQKARSQGKTQHR